MFLGIGRDTKISGKREKEERTITILNKLHIYH